MRDKLQSPAPSSVSMNHDPFYSSPFSQFYRRHTPYMGQPDFRIFELNKRLQQRTEVSEYRAGRFQYKHFKLLFKLCTVISRCWLGVSSAHVTTTLTIKKFTHLKLILFNKKIHSFLQRNTQLIYKLNGHDELIYYVIISRCYFFKTACSPFRIRASYLPL